MYRILMFRSLPALSISITMNVVIGMVISIAIGSSIVEAVADSTMIARPCMSDHFHV